MTKSNTFFPPLKSFGLDCAAHNVGKTFRFEARATDQRPVDFGLAHEFLNVGWLDAPTILDAAGLPHGELPGYTLSSPDEIPPDRVRRFYRVNEGPEEGKPSRPPEKPDTWEIRGDKITRMPR